MVPIRRFLETQLDINKAIQGERDIPPDLTPPSIAEVAIAGNESDFANYLKGRLRKGLEIDTPEVLFAPKSFTGYRPVSLLSFEQRVAYRCIVSSVTERLDASVVSYNQFKKAPLADEGVQFIAISDVASFYQHVNQRLVEAEIVNRTGMADLAYLVTSLLSDISRSPTGLAQGYFGSKPLAELVIDIAERRLLRTGMQIWRYNDDFRIGASSWTEAHRALELLTSELSLLGMNINEHKTWIVPRDRYAELLKEAHQRLRLRFVDEDSEDDGEEEYDEASRSNEMPYDAETHAKIINELKTFNSEERAIRGGLEALVRRSVLGLALMLLTKWKKSEGLTHCPMILAYEPGLTIKVARYLTSLDEVQAREGIEHIACRIRAGQLRLNDWQTLWVLHAAEKLTSVLPETGLWLTSLLLSTRSQAVRSKATLVEANCGRGRFEEVIALFDPIKSYAKPDIVAAASILGMSSHKRVKRSLSSENPLYSWIISKIEQRHESPPW